MKIFNIPDAQLRQVLNSNKKASMGYYTEDNARAAARLLDKLHGEGHVLRLNPGKASATTVRLQYYQGARYLLDNLDPQGTYKTLYHKTVCRTYEGYIELHIRNSLRDCEDTAKQIIPWKEALEEFLEKAKPDEKFHRTGLELTDENLAWIEGQLSTLKKENGEDLFYGQVLKDSILLVRDND